MTSKRKRRRRAGKRLADQYDNDWWEMQNAADGGLLERAIIRAFEVARGRRLAWLMGDMIDWDDAGPDEGDQLSTF